METLLKKHLLVPALAIGLLGSMPTWAGSGSTEEISPIMREQEAAFEKGNVEGYLAAFAPNAAFTGSFQPLRIEGRATVKDYFTTLFETYPTRHLAVRSSSLRSYGNDTGAVSNGYYVLTVTDKSVKATTQSLRTSTTWVKFGEEWRTADQHVSEMPTGSPKPTSSFKAASNQ